MTAFHTPTRLVRTAGAHPSAHATGSPKRFALPGALWVVLAALVTIAGPAAATDFGHHPAATAARPVAGIDPSTFIPGHPARGAAGHAGHANFEHPALATYRAGQKPHINADTFIVQPPATTAWIVVAPQMWASLDPR